MNIMFAQVILQKESKRCGFVTGYDRGTLWVACRKMSQIKVGFTSCGIFPFHNRFFVCITPYAGTRLIFIFRFYSLPKWV